MNHTVIDAFTGGWNRMAVHGIADNESPDLFGVVGDQAVLKTIPGTAPLNTSEIVSGNPTWGLFRYYRTGQAVNDSDSSSVEAWTVAKCGAGIWIDVNGLGDFRPILGNRTPGRESFCQFGDFLYITNGVDYNARFTGEFYCNGTVTCTGTSALTGTGTAWASYTSVKAGDVIFIKAGGVWNLTQHRVVTVASNGSITMDGNGPVVSGADYMIARTQAMGIAAPTVAPTLTTDATTPPVVTGNFVSNGGFESSFTDWTPSAQVIVATSPVHSGSKAASMGASSGSLVSKDYLAGSDFVAGTSYALQAWVQFTVNRHAFNASLTVTITPDVGSPSAFTIVGTPANQKAWLSLTGMVPTDPAATKLSITVSYRGRNAQCFVDDISLAGISGGGSAPTSPDELAPGTYLYAYTWSNPLTGYESNPSPTSDPVLIDATHLKAIVTGWPVSPTDPQVSQLNIYRTYADNTTPMYFVASILRDQAGYTFPATYHDIIADTALGAELLADSYPPPIFTHLLQFNDRLYGWGTVDHPERLYFSTLETSEYWPTFQWAINEPGALLTDRGGFVTIGRDTRDRITGVVPEGGAYSTTGLSGSNLLVFTSSLGKRWFGMDYNDFYLVDAFATGCAAHETAQNCDGIVVWLSLRGIFMVQAGGSAPVPIYLKIKDIIPDEVTVPTRISLQSANAAYWRGYYILSWMKSPATENSDAMMFHVPSQTYWPLSGIAANAFSVWSGPGDDDQIYFGSSTQGYVCNLFGGVNPTAWQWRSKLYNFAENPSQGYFVKDIDRIVLSMKSPAVDQDVTCKIYTNGRTSGAAYEATLTVAATDDSTKRVYPVFLPQNVDCRSAQIELSGTATEVLQLYGAEIRTTVHGPSQDMDIG